MESESEISQMKSTILAMIWNECFNGISFSPWGEVRNKDDARSACEFRWKIYSAIASLHHSTRPKKWRGDRIRIST